MNHKFGIHAFFDLYGFQLSFMHMHIYDVGATVDGRGGALFSLLFISATHPSPTHHHHRAGPAEALTSTACIWSSSR